LSEINLKLIFKNIRILKKNILKIISKNEVKNIEKQTIQKIIFTKSVIKMGNTVT